MFNLRGYTKKDYNGSVIGSTEGVVTTSSRKIVTQNEILDFFGEFRNFLTVAYNSSNLVTA